MSKLINSKSLFKKALNKKFAVPCFNCNNMEFIKAILKSSNTLKSPIILAFSEGAIKYMGLNTIVALVNAEIKNVKIPVVLHLDHGTSYEICKKAIDSGFTSVMIDASHLSLKENIALTKKVCTYAHNFNVSVEAEVGQLKGTEDNISSNKNIYTNPLDAFQFIKETSCDSLAIAIGTSHGAYKFAGDPHLRFDILKEIQKFVKSYPFVLHGASSVPENLKKECDKLGANLKDAKGVSTALLKTAIKNGIAKINIDTDLRLAFYKGVKSYLLKNPETIDPRKYLESGMIEIEKIVAEKIKILNSANIA